MFLQNFDISYNQFIVGLYFLDCEFHFYIAGIVWYSKNVKINVLKKILDRQIIVTRFFNNIAVAACLF